MGGTVELMWEKKSQQRKERTQEGEIGDAEGRRACVWRVRAFPAADKRMLTLDSPAHTCASVGALPSALFQISGQLCVIYDSFIRKRLFPLWKC